MIWVLSIEREDVDYVAWTYKPNADNLKNVGLSEKYALLLLQWGVVVDDHEISYHLFKREDGDLI